MELKATLKELMDNAGSKASVDVVLKNGNILLRNFHIVEFDEIKSLLKGITMQEQYTSLKENRNPVYCFFRIDEIKEIEIAEMVRV
jgi:hypothetical protein